MDKGRNHPQRLMEKTYHWDTFDEANRGLNFEHDAVEK